jgi:hypothetical protein
LNDPPALHHPHYGLIEDQIRCRLGALVLVIDPHIVRRLVVRRTELIAKTGAI